jgi:hypothetical protein
MISWCGIVPRDRLREEPALMEQTWATYRHRRDNPTVRLKQPSSVSSVEMIGVWDTVEALGLPSHANRPEDVFGYHDVNFTDGLNSAYHALAIDDHRAHFAPVLWPADLPGHPPGIEQVWFAGAHSDVGGGYSDHGLADIALLWMIGRAERHGLQFAAESICELRPDPCATLHDSYTGIYKERGCIDRVIGPNSLIHPSVFKRRAPHSDYKPSNLAGWPIGASESSGIADDVSSVRCS